MMTINKEAIYKLALWFVVFYLIGGISGAYFGGYAIGKKLNDSVRIGGIIIEDRVYDLKARM